MRNKQRFEVRLDTDAVKEYQKIDNSVIEMVDKAIDELEKRADEVGKPLGNKRDIKLAGCKEIKLRDVGIRIIFRITNEVVDILRIVYVLTIESRSEDYVFKSANRRFKILKEISSKYRLSEFFKRSIKWSDRKK